MNTLRSFLGLTPTAHTNVIALPDRSGESESELGTVAARRPIGKRLGVLLAAIAVPAMAAPGDFGAMPGAAPTEAEMVNARLAAQLAENPAMPFEKPGMSFPGSAFFFLADRPGEALIGLAV